MKRIVHLFVAIAISFYSFGQVQLGVFAGPQASTAKYLINNQKQPAKYKYGFQAGAFVKIPFEGNLYFSPTLYYTLKGYKVTLKDASLASSTASINSNTTIHSFEGAALLQYDFGKDPSHFFIKAGPALDIAVAGREKYNTHGGDLIKQNMPFGFENYGRYGATAIMQLGYETADGLIIFVHYDKGFGNISNVDGGPKIMNRVFGISIGKFIGSNKIVLNTKNKE